MVKLIIQDYKIADKEKTYILLRTMCEVKTIYEAWSSLSPEAREKTDAVLDAEIDRKLDKCFKWYQEKYDVEIEEGYGREKDIEINLSNICEKIKSWEE